MSSPSFWSSFVSLGIAALFAVRKARRTEALEKAARKAAELKAAIESMRIKNDVENRVKLDDNPY